MSETNENLTLSLTLNHLVHTYGLPTVLNELANTAHARTMQNRHQFDERDLITSFIEKAHNQAKELQTKEISQ